MKEIQMKYANVPEKFQIKIVQLHGELIQYIKNPSEQVQIESVKQSGHAIWMY